MPLGAVVRRRDIAAALDVEHAAIADRGCERRAWTDEAALDQWTAAQIADGRVVGWYQGRMEWGPAPWAIAASSPIRGAPTWGDHQHAHQVSRALPAVRAVGAGEALDDCFVGAVPVPSCCRRIRCVPTSAPRFRRSRTWTAPPGCRPSAAIESELLER